MQEKQHHKYVVVDTQTREVITSGDDLDDLALDSEYMDESCAVYELSHTVSIKEIEFVPIKKKKR